MIEWLNCSEMIEWFDQLIDYLTVLQAYLEKHHELEISPAVLDEDDDENEKRGR